MNRIRELRQARGWNQEDLAARLNTKRQTVGRYETEERGIDADTICQLCDIFGCTADYLLCRSNAPSPAVTDEDAELLRAFHAAPEHLQKAARTMLGLDDQADKTKEKSEAS